MHRDSVYLGQLFKPARRRWLASTAAGAAALALPWSLPADAKDRQIHDLRGQVSVNGVRATRDTVINVGDTVVTGSDGYVVFVVGESAFLLRSRSELVIERPRDAASVALGLLRLVSGALGATFKRGTPVALRTMNATIGIRGTGVYMETRGTGTYFCTCWGETEVGVVETVQREFVKSTRHNPRLLAYKADADGNYSRPATFETHTDAEMDMLEKCVGRRAPWIAR
jgi:hypothetical protein